MDSELTPDEKADIAMRLMNMNVTLRTLKAHLEDAGDIANAVGAAGIAVATFHLAESIDAYSRAINRYVVDQLSKNSS